MQVTPQNFAETNGGRERRERPRRAPSSISYVSVDNAHGGVIVDISEMGMAISSAEPIAEGASHTLRFQLPRIERMFETPASLVWTSSTKRNAGVRFDSLTMEDRLLIRNWLKDELFAEAFPARAAARRKLVFSLDTLGETGTRAAPATGAPSANASATPLPISAATVGAASRREVTPLVPRKELSDIQARVTTDRSSDFERMFPSEKTLGVELQPRPGKFARLAESTSSIETTARWMNFPSEAELAAAVATDHAAAAQALAPVAAVVDVPPTEAASEAIEAHETRADGLDVASGEATGVAEDAALPSVATDAQAELSSPMAAATAELIEAEKA